MIPVLCRCNLKTGHLIKLYLLTIYPRKSTIVSSTGDYSTWKRTSEKRKYQIHSSSFSPDGFIELNFVSFWRHGDICSALQYLLAKMHFYVFSWEIESSNMEEVWLLKMFKSKCFVVCCIIYEGEWLQNRGTITPYITRCPQQINLCFPLAGDIRIGVVEGRRRRSHAGSGEGWRTSEYWLWGGESWGGTCAHPPIACETRLRGNREPSGRLRLHSTLLAFYRWLAVEHLRYPFRRP